MKKFNLILFVVISISVFVACTDYSIIANPTTDSVIQMDNPSYCVSNIMNSDRLNAVDSMMVEIESMTEAISELKAEIVLINYINKCLDFAIKNTKGSVKDIRLAGNVSVDRWHNSDILEEYNVRTTYFELLEDIVEAIKNKNNIHKLEYNPNTGTLEIYFFDGYDEMANITARIVK